MLPLVPRRVSLPTPLALALVVVLVLTLGGVGFAAGQVTSAQIKNNSVKGKDIKDSSLTGRDVHDSSLTGKDLANGSLGSAELTLQRGETLRGVYAASGEADTSLVAVTFSVPAPTPVDSAHVRVVGYDVPLPESGCFGNVEAPVAAPGYVCIYPGVVTGTSFMYGWGALCSCADASADTGDGTRFGFLVQSIGSNSSHANKGTWAYTAP